MNGLEWQILNVRMRKLGEDLMKEVDSSRADQPGKRAGA